MDDLHRSAAIAVALSPGRVSARAMRRASEVVRTTPPVRRCTRCGEAGHRRDYCPAPETAPPVTERARILARDAERAAARADGDPRAELLGHEGEDSAGAQARIRARCRCPGTGEGDAIAELVRWQRWGCGLHDDRRATRIGVSRVLRERA